MDAAHYFSAEPTGPEHRRRLEVTLAGRQVSVETATGIFSPDGLDKGTAALLATVPEPPEAGSFLDVGCGWGPLALTLGLSRPASRITAVEVNRRAAGLCRDNAAALGLENITVLDPEEVPAHETFDLIWSNPPIRVGKPALHAILRQWLPRLNPGGTAYLVVQKNLGADSLLPWIGSTLDELHPESFRATRHATEKGFRILRVDRILTP